MTLITSSKNEAKVGRPSCSGPKGTKLKLFCFWNEDFSIELEATQKEFSWCRSLHIFPSSNHISFIQGQGMFRPVLPWCATTSVKSGKYGTIWKLPESLCATKLTKKVTRKQSRQDIMGKNLPRGTPHWTLPWQTSATPVWPTVSPQRQQLRNCAYISLHLLQLEQGQHLTLHLGCRSRN